MDTMVFSWEKSEDNFNNRSFFLMGVGGCNDDRCTQKRGDEISRSHPPKKRRGQNVCSSMTLPSLSTARQWMILRASEEMVTPHLVTVRPSAS